MPENQDVDNNQEDIVEDVNEEITEQSEEPEEEIEEVIVSFAGEEPPVEEEARAPEWVRELRKTNREKERRIRELEAKLSATTTETKPVVTLGPKPKLEDHDYDAERYEQSIDQWHERKREHDREAEQAKQSEQQEQKEWQNTLDKYSKAKAELKVRDYEDAEELVQQALNVTQQGVLLKGCDNPALVVYAIGKNPKIIAELAAEKDIIQFTFKLAQLQNNMTVKKRKQPPAPELVVSGTGRSSGAVDSTLERLREEAKRTGNFTKVVAYKRDKRG